MQTHIETMTAALAPQEGKTVNRWQVIRYERGLSLEDAARISGIAKGTIYRFEHGKVRRPHARVARALARLYDVTIDDILGLS